MCFSATASFVSGTALLATGFVTGQRAGRAAALPFAWMPAVFGIQQLIEGGLWLTFESGNTALSRVLTPLYSLFSQVIWPVYVPLAVLLLESTPWRQKVMAVIACAGAMVSAFLLYSMVTVEVTAQVEAHHIAYVFPHFHTWLASALYVLGACASPLLSSHRTVRLFGVAATASMVVTAIFYSQWFTSVWCFFAAMLSAVIWFHFPKSELTGTQRAIS